MNLTEILTRAADLRIAVIGDLILDRYVFGEVSRISPEAPVPVLRVTDTKENPGGAGNVVENLRGLGCEVSFFHQPSPPIKTRIMSGSHHMLRMDDEDQPEWMRWDDVDLGLAYGIDNKKYDCVIISDYGKGAVSRDITSRLIRKCNEKEIPIVVDTKNQIGIMYSATTIKCNRKEWLAFLDVQNFIDPWNIHNIGDIKNLVITNGDRGMQYWGKDGGLELSGNIPGLATDICDPCGAGDTVTAVLGVMEALGYGISDACTLANIAASEVCRHPGVYSITKDDLIRRFNELRK
jgi:rfaE bifunctional protein kinase chain/domain